MRGRRACFFWLGALAFSLSVAHAQSAQQIIQQVVETEHAADQEDRSQWSYLEEIRKPKGQILQWVASTPQGDIDRILQENEQRLSPAQQQDLIEKFLRNPSAQRRQVSESDHDLQQIYSLLKLLPVAFIWTKTGETPTTTSLHFEPDPNFHPPTREAHVFGGMAGDLVVHNREHRIQSMRGYLLHDVTFGGGILGRLKEGSSFSLEQEKIRPSLWELTAFHLSLHGNALLFKSISLQQDDDRSDFEPESSIVTFNQAFSTVMSRPETAREPAGH